MAANVLGAGVPSVQCPRNIPRPQLPRARSPTVGGSGGGGGGGGEMFSKTTGRGGFLPTWRPLQPAGLPESAPGARSPACSPRSIPGAPCWEHCPPLTTGRLQTESHTRALLARQWRGPTAPLTPRTLFTCPLRSPPLNAPPPGCWPTGSDQGSAGCHGGCLWPGAAHTSPQPPLEVRTGGKARGDGAGWCAGIAKLHRIAEAARRRPEGPGGAGTGVAARGGRGLAWTGCGHGRPAHAPGVPAGTHLAPAPRSHTEAVLAFEQELKLLMRPLNESTRP